VYKQIVSAVKQSIKKVSATYYSYNPQLWFCISQF